VRIPIIFKNVLTVAIITSVVSRINLVFLFLQDGRGGAGGALRNKMNKAAIFIFCFVIHRALSQIVWTPIMVDVNSK